MDSPSGIEAPPARQRRKQSDRREEAERRILQSAMELVSEKGVTGTTLGEVGERAGYSRGLPAHHYGNKEGLLTALVGRIGRNFRAARNAAGPWRPGLDAILGVVGLYIDRAASHDCATRALYIMFTEAFVSGGALAVALDQFNRASLAYFEGHLRIGVRKQEIRADVDPVAESIVILGALRGISAQFLLGSPHANPAQVRDALVGTMARALRPDPTA